MSALTLTVPRWPWVRDFAIVGGVTGFLAPFSFWRLLEYSLFAGVGGGVGGAALGLFSAWLMGRHARRWRRIVLFPLGLLFGALWGATAGAATGLSSDLRSLMSLSMIVAALAGALQLGWFWLVYSVRRMNQRSTWPVVLVASVLGGGLGFAGVFGFGLLFGLVRAG